MMKKQENKFFCNPGKKTGIIHILVSMAVGLFITATAFAAGFTVSGPVTASQILHGTNLTGTITASGSITITELGGLPACPVIMTGSTNMTVLNQGGIFATGIDGVKGIQSRASDLINSRIENANILSVTTTGTNLVGGSSNFLESVGIGGEALVDLDNTHIINSGTLSAEGTRSVLGIYTGGLSNTSSITNSGTLSINQTAAAWAGGPVYGIKTGDLDNSSVLNTGTLSVNSIFGGTGIYSKQVENNSTIINSGQIKLIGTYGTGLYVFVLSNNSTVKNTGSISITQTGAGTTSYGIHVDRIQKGAVPITNTGHITLTTNDPSSTAYGVYSRGASFENSGTITALDSTGAMGANMYSVFTGGSLENKAGGTMKGVFEAGNTINSGVIAMPAVTSAITGNFNQTDSGILGITLFSDDTPANTTYSKLTVSGTTTLATGSGIDVDVTTAKIHQDLLIGQTLTQVIKSTGGILADPASLKVTDNSALLKFTPSLSAGNTSLDLGVEKGMTMAQAAVVGGCPGVAGAGAALDSLTGSSNPQISAFIANLNTLPTERGVARRLQQAAPISAAQGPAMASQMANTMSGVIQVRQQGLRGVNSGDPLFSEKNVWVKPYASWTDQDDVDGVAGFTADTLGIGIGADGEYAGDHRLGLAFFYTSAQTQTNNTPQETDLDLFSLMAYGSSPVMDKTIIDYQMGAGLQPTESNRYIQASGATASADYTAKNLFAQAKAAREFDLAQTIRAMVGPKLSYLWFHTPAYQETGAGGMNLNVDSVDSQALVAALEGDVTWSFPKDVDFMVTASLGYDLINDSTLVKSSFQGGGALFQTSGLDNSPVVYGLGLGLAKKFTDLFSLDAKYDLEGRGSDLSSHMVSAKLNWKF